MNASEGEKVTRTVSRSLPTTFLPLNPREVSSLVYRRLAIELGEQNATCETCTSGVEVQVPIDPYPPQPAHFRKLFKSLLTLPKHMMYRQV